MSKPLAIIVGLIVVGALLLFSMTYTVRFHEVAIKTRFGETTENSVVTEEGLKFKLPLFVDKVAKIDTRMQLRESSLETVLTSDDQQVVVRAFMLWKVDTEGDGPLKFFRNYASVQDANDGFTNQFRTALNTGLTRFAFHDLIGSESKLAETEQSILKELQPLAGKGIKPVSVGISQLLLTPSTSKAVLSRMEATRTRLSENQRELGKVEADNIETDARTWSDKIVAFATQRAEEIRSRGNVAAAKYLEQMGAEEDLAVFLVWIDAFKQSLSENTTLVIPTTFAPFHLLQFDTPKNEAGIPLPTSTNELPGLHTSAQPPVDLVRDTEGGS